MTTTEELLARKSSSSGLEIQEYRLKDVTLTMWHPLSEKVGTNLADDKLRLLSRYSLLMYSGHEVFFLYVYMPHPLNFNSLSYVCKQIQVHF
jgi:hypothetical protein